MWFFKNKPKIETPASRLRKRRACTVEGQEIITKAYYIARANPQFTDGQCIRAAYWGNPGNP